MTYEKLARPLRRTRCGRGIHDRLRDNGSDDGSPDELRRDFRARDDRDAVHHLRVLRQRAAMLAGFKNAVGDLGC